MKLTREKLKLKLVNKVLSEFNENFNAVNTDKEVKIDLNLKDEDELKKLVDELKENKDNFILGDITNITLFQELSKQDGYHSNGGVVWDYLFKVFFLCLKGEIDDSIFNMMRKDSEKIIEQKYEPPEATIVTSGTTETMANPFGSMLEGTSLMSMVTEIAAGLAPKLASLKGTNPDQLLSMFMSGGGSIGGLNITEIVSDIQVQIEAKISSGEMDEKVLEMEAKKIAGAMNLDVSKFKPSTE